MANPHRVRILLSENDGQEPAPLVYRIFLSQMSLLCLVLTILYDAPVDINSLLQFSSPAIISVLTIHESVSFLVVFVVLMPVT
ncbi:hypothetical protein F5B22DRAFT_595071 [Xylaria bambusicola]|uniref:uncharacterized protein n=1 Tax=Xylaria bambusicola TaxID=326684 RepID=UPI00200846C7|nr:uncharacterized protein F5B22DRAFT_595071 [Xylaria bambusicola]KAI0521465.1 hypothetical protein F5B22DRAFT_595071 [Xylaria bambusicola]